MEPRLVAFGFVGAFAFAAQASAQTQMSTIHGDAAGDHFGAEIALVGDVDGDGVEDWAVGAPGANAGPAGDVGRVNVYSGRHQGLLRSWPGTAARDYFGTSIARAGDVDGDGFDDVAIGAPQYDGFAHVPFGPGFAQVRSGASGAVLLSFALAGSERLGWAIDGGGRIDGDGVPDLIVGDPDANSCAGAVHAVSGASGALIYTINGGTTNFGHAVAFLGDLDGDGRDEFAVGEPDTCAGTIFDGYVSVYSGLAGALAWSAPGISGNCGNEYGWSVERSLDLSGDGLADVLVGGRDTNCFAGGSAGFADVRDGVTGALLFRRQPSAPSFSGYGVGLASCRDLDGDGAPEVALGAPGEISGTNEDVLVCSGATTLTLAALSPGVASDAWGHALASFDATDDGLEDLLVGAPLSDLGAPDAGSVTVFTIVRGVTSYCDAESNSLGCTPAIAGLGAPSATSASVFDVRATNVLNQKTGLCFYGFKPRQTPFQGGFMCITAPFQRTALQGSGGNPPPANDCSGAFSLDFNARIQSGIDPLLVAGAEVFAQYWSRDPADPSTTNLTDALAFLIHP